MIAEAGLDVLFQSLLCWIVVRDPAWPREYDADLEVRLFQSLLCWIVVRDRSVSLGDAQAKPLKRFNPCCVGSLSETRIASVIRSCSQ